MELGHFSDEAFAAYLAAFTDGEGWLGAPPGGGCRIVLANCVPSVLEEIQQRLGCGTIRSQQQKAHWRERFVLVFQNAAECRQVLDLIEPYLRIKGATAALMRARLEEWDAAVAEYDERNRLIREALAAGERGKDIAARFGVSPQTVSRLKLGHTWQSERPATARGLQGRVSRHRSWTSAPRRPAPSDGQPT